MRQSNAARGRKGSVIGWIALIIAVAALILAVIAVNRTGVNVDEVVANEVREATAGWQDELGALREQVEEGTRRAEEAVSGAAAGIADTAEEGVQNLQGAAEETQEAAEDDAADAETDVQADTRADTQPNTPGDATDEPDATGEPTGDAATESDAEATADPDAAENPADESTANASAAEPASAAAETRDTPDEPEQDAPATEAENATDGEAANQAGTDDLAAARNSAAERLTGISIADTTTQQGREDALELVRDVRGQLAESYQNADAEDQWQELEGLFEQTEEVLQNEPEGAADALQELVNRLEQGGTAQ